MKNLYTRSTVRRLGDRLRCSILIPPIVCLFLIATIASIPTWAAESSSSVPSAEENSGGKRTNAEIKVLTRQVRQGKSNQFSMGPSTRWLEKTTSEKGHLASQKTFAHAVNASAEAIESIRSGHRRGLDISVKVDELIELRNQIASADNELRRTFDATAARCKQMGLSDEILARHVAMVENHEKHFQTLMKHFDQLERLARVPGGDRSDGEMLTVIDRLATFIATHQTIKAPPQSSYGLPHAIRIVPAPTAEITEADVSTLAPTKAQSKNGKPIHRKPIAPSATNVDTNEATIVASAISGTPAAEDLDPTIDVQITQEIIDLAASLDQSPLEIYAYVHDRIDFEPYLGSRKGSQETLNQGAGNDYDQSTLLMALLRASNIPARYVRGTVEMPVEQAMNWLGVDDAATAGSILTTVGMQGVTIVEGSDIVAIRFEHVWVEAYLPYTNYRGIPVDGTGKMWVPMDPSIKSYAYQAGMDVLTEMGFDPETFIDDYITTYHEPSPVELMIQEIQNYLALNDPDRSYADIVRTREIDTESIGFIPGALPFKVLSIDDDFAEIPSDKRYSVRFHLYNGGTTFIDYTANLPEIAGKRVTIAYRAASQADQDVIDAYGDLYATPPYLVNLKPVLRIDGTEVAVSTNSIGMGLTHNSDLHFTTPVGETNVMPVVSNSIIAGTYQAIGIDTGRIDPDVFMPADIDSPTTDDVTGGKLWRSAMGYLDRIERNDGELASAMQMVVTKDVSEAIVENTILVTYSFGTPQTFEWTGLVVDADRCIVGPFAVDGDSAKSKPFMVLSGADGSISENRIFEDEYDEEAVSTIKILELASDMGIPVYTFGSGDIGSIYSTLNLSASVESAIYSAVAAGHEVTVPRDNITYIEWSGTGYIDMDPSTGAAGYIISGGHSGGATVDIWISWKMVWFTIFRDLCDTNPITANITFPPAGAYFPALNWWDFLTANQLRFDVTYTICYDGGGTQTVYETFKPHYPYSPGDYTFTAGWGTGATRDFTVFGVEITTPDGEKAIVGCDRITLDTKFTPRTPPGVTYAWMKGSCWFGCGDGTFNPANAASTEFEGTAGGDVVAKIEATNTYGTTKAQKDLLVIGVKKIKAVDSDDGSNTAEDTDKAVEADIKTIYVPKKDTGTVNITVETEPSVTEADLPADWKIEKISGTLNFDGAVGKLSGRIRKNSEGEIVIRVMPCSSSSDHFYLKIIVFKVEFVTPKGDPVAAPDDSGDGQNEFTFSNAAPGILSMDLKSKITPAGIAAKIKSKVKYFVDGIGSSTRSWSAANPNGEPSVNADYLEAHVEYTGLPAHNSDFGKKKVKIRFNDKDIEETEIEVFFDKSATNHPGTGSGTVPNWFYYWQDGDVCGIEDDYIYDSTASFGYTLPGTDDIVRLGPDAPTSNTGPETYNSGNPTYGSITVTGQGDGIQCVAETIQHELHHLTIYDTFHDRIAVAHANGGANNGDPDDDPDGDEIPNGDEPTYNGIKSDPSDPDTFNMGGTYASYGDQEVRCRDIELHLTIAYHKDKDWANPGCQSKNKFGP